MERWIVDNEPSGRYPLYTRGNVGEVFPLPVAPLTWTFGAIPCAEPGWRDALARFGAFDLDEFSSEGIDILGCFGGYCYLNVSVSRIFGVRTPGLTPEQIDYSLWGQMDGVPPYAPQPTDESPKHSEKIGQTLGWILTADSLPDLAADRAAMAKLRAERPDYGAMSDEALIERNRALLPELRRLYSEHLFITYCATVPVGIIQTVCSEIGDPTLAMKLVAGLGDVDSAAPSYAMWDLGRLVAGSKELTAAFDAGLDGLRKRLAGLSSGDASQFAGQFSEFIYEFGSRGPNEWETSSPSWETRPELALAAIDRMRLAEADASPRGRYEALAAEREGVSKHLIGALKSQPEAQGQFAAAVNAAKVFLPGRERTKTNVIRLINEIRVGNEVLGDRMVERGIFDERTAASMLLSSELDDFLANPSKYADVIRERSAQYRTLFHLEPPFIIDGTVPPLASWARRDAAHETVAAGTDLAGIPGCPGKATGRARVVLDPADPRGLEPGDVLVAPITDPAWTPLFVPASAVVVDVGAQLSHAVIVSRELGIPCVVSVTGATRKIRDGATVTVDGTTGVVTVN